MTVHNSNELNCQVNILAPDGLTVLAGPIGARINDLSFLRREQAQIAITESTHMILVRTPDAGTLTPACYIQEVANGRIYIVDDPRDKRIPRDGMWLEVFCHVERTNS